MKLFPTLLAIFGTVNAFVPSVYQSTNCRRVSVQPLYMANSASAEKRIRTSERNRVRNAAWRSRVRTWIRKTKEAIDAEDVEAAKESARMATSMIDRATRRKIYHKNWAARNKSRLSKKVIALILKKRGEDSTSATAASA